MNKIETSENLPSLDLPELTIKKYSTPMPEITKIIFDWDDTFNPTSWLHKIARPLSQEHRRYLSDISTLVIMIITQAKLYGDVIIITNADEGWVEDSCSINMPFLLPHLSNISIISAQARYSKLYKDSRQWKIAAFHEEVVKKLISPHKVNVISIGDSNFELSALNSLKCMIPAGLHIELITKGVKLLEKPDHLTLIKELNIINTHIKSIIELPISYNQMITLEES